VSLTEMKKRTRVQGFSQGIPTYPWHAGRGETEVRNFPCGPGNKEKTSAKPVERHKRGDRGRGAYL